MAHAAHFMSKYNDAKYYYRMFNRLTNPKDRPERHNMYIDKAMSDCDYAIMHNHINDTIILENLGGTVNTKYPEYNPVVDSKDSVLYYTSRRPENNNGTIDPDDNKYFEDVYQCINSAQGYTKPEKFEILEYVTSDKEFNKNLVHKSVVALSFDEKELFMFKENKLWKSKKKLNGTWDTPELMDSRLNVTKYQSHTTLSPDGKSMYIAAEATNIIGNRDIQVSHRKDDGNWDIPSSISDSINTPFEENSPTICNDGKTMYFSSQGLPGYGGYDIYKTTFKNGHWTTPLNMGLPINSPGDDIYFSDNTNDGIAYFSSHRLGGYGDQDIYKVTATPEQLIEYIPKPFVIELDGTKSIDKDGTKLIYDWDFGDGTNERGATLQHGYQRPGKYLVKLNTIDESSKFTDYDEYEIPVDISNATHIEIAGADTIYEGQRVALDGTYSSIKNVPISKRQWQLSDGTRIKDSVIIHRTYDKLGIYPEKYICRGRNDSLHLKVGYYYTKNIVVIPEADYKSVKSRREKKERIRKHFVDSTSTMEEHQLSHRSLSAPTIETSTLADAANPNTAPTLTTEEKAEIALAKKEREANLKVEKDFAEKDFVSEALANKGGDVALRLEEGFDASTTKLDTTNLPDAKLESIFFDLDKFIIRKDAANTLDKNIAIMKLYPEFVFKVSGFTDVRGSDEYNIRLSNKRSLSAIAYLVKNGIPENRITGILSMGEKTAGFKDDTKTGINEKEYQFDRRVDFRVLGKIIK
jgi:outer membrane protein OmpA-like peptidoglycan-associated protein